MDQHFDDAIGRCFGWRGIAALDYFDLRVDIFGRAEADVIKRAVFIAVVGFVGRVEAEVLRLQMANDAGGVQAEFAAAFLPQVIVQAADRFPVDRLVPGADVAEEEGEWRAVGAVRSFGEALGEHAEGDRFGIDRDGEHEGDGDGQAGDGCQGEEGLCQQTLDGDDEDRAGSQVGAHHGPMTV